MIIQYIYCQCEQLLRMGIIMVNADVLFVVLLRNLLLFTVIMDFSSIHTASRIGSHPQTLVEIYIRRCIGR
jgi:hypothetical protein